MKEIIIRTGRPIGIGVALGFILLLAFGKSLPDSSFATLFCVMVLGAVWGLVGILLSRKPRESYSAEETKAHQTTFTVILLIGSVAALILGQFLVAAVLGIAVIGAWYDRSKM